MTITTCLTEFERYLIKDLISQTIVYGKRYQKLLPINLNEYPKSLHKARGCFISIEKDNEVINSIGKINSKQDFIHEIINYVYASCFLEYKITANTSENSKALTIGIAIVTGYEDLTFKTEQDLIMNTHKDNSGLVLKNKNHYAVLLPNAWNKYNGPKEFINRLKKDARLPENYWSNNITITKFTTDYFTFNITFN